MAVLLGVGDGDAQVAGLRLACVCHGRALHGVLCAVGIEAPCLAIERGFYLVLVEEGGVLELRPDLIELLGLAQVYLYPLAMRRAGLLAVPVAVGGLPQRGVVVVDGILRAEPLVVVARCRHFGTVGQVLVLSVLEDGNVLCIVRGDDGLDVALGIELQFVDAYLAIEAVYRLRIVVAVVDDVVASVYLDNGVMARAVYGLVLVGGQQFAFVFEGPHRSRLRRGILHTVGIGVARATAVGEVVGAASLEDEGSLEDVLQLCVGYQSFLAEELVGSNGEGIVLVPSAGISPLCLMHCGLCIDLRHAAAETLVDAPGGEVEVLAAVVVAKELGVEGNDVVDVAVGHHHGIVLAQDVLPRADGRRALADVDVARLAVVVAERAVGLLHHVGCPYDFGGGPVHHDVLPVHEVLAHPHLCRAVAVACAIGGGIEVVGIAKLADGGVGEVARNKGIGIAWRIPRRARDGRGLIFAARLLGRCRCCNEQQE